MKIKLLVGLLLGLGIASLSEAFTVDNRTPYPVRVAYEFSSCVIHSGIRRNVYVAPNSYLSIEIPCSLRWAHVQVNYNGTATDASDNHAWTYEGTQRWATKWSQAGMPAPQRILITPGFSELGEPKVSWEVTRTAL